MEWEGRKGIVVKEKVCCCPSRVMSVDIIRVSTVFRSLSPTPMHRRLSGRRSRTPPPTRGRRSSPIPGRRVRSRSRSPPRYGRVGTGSSSRDAREIIRREIEKRGSHTDPFLRERERQVCTCNCLIL